ncbi:adenylate cyclase [Rhodospirillales bacterium URHD0017]|nr:adenylate cyclase [Rhodospirillales bacterium URHD0017]
MAREQRKLAAIVAADVVGFSRLMGRDESGTLARLRQNRSEHLEPVLAKYGGRLVKLTGDGALVEFASAVDALSAAIEFQQAMAEANCDQPADTVLVFRMGLHLGDLIVDGDDLYGDGVNVAARLEGEAPAGGILISGNVRDAVAGRLNAKFEDLGGLSLKNIERPVHAFNVRWEPSDWQVAVTAEVTALPAIAPQVTLPLPDKPSIAVLPFQNMSGDPEQEYFVDGLVEDIITALSRAKSLFVIARNSSFTYKGRAVDIKQVGHELGVRYVLEGSVRKVGNRVRITGQLIDVATGSHIWADRFEDDLADIFGLQDRVTSSVVGAIFPNLELAEISRARQKVGSLAAYDYYLQSLAAFYRFTRQDHEEALNLLQKAIDLDPEFALAHAIKSHWHCGVRKSSGWDDNPAQERKEAEWLARRAMELDRNDPRVLANVGVTLAWGLLRCQEGSDLIDQALEIDPNYALAWSWGAVARVGLGDHDGAIKYCERALRLSPLDPRAFVAANAMASVHFLAGRYEEAASWAAKALRQHHGYPLAMQTTVASYALAGRIEDAERACALYLQLHPQTRLSNIKDRMLCVREEDIHKYVTGLRLAGLPE